MGEMENQSEFYYERLRVSTNPGKDLLDFFRETTGRDAGRAEIILINKLIKLFSRFTVFFAIMDLSKYQSDQLNGNLYPLLYTICKSRFEKIHDEIFSQAHESLDKFLRDVAKEREKVQRSRGKLPTSDDL
jgi:hypothetical protein